MFNLEFLPISLVVIYVGAIAVLFLFVLMMLNIKFAELTNNSISNLPFAIIFSLAFIIEFFYLLKFEFFSLQLTNDALELFIFEFSKSFSIDQSFLNFCQLSSNIQVVSFALFNNYLYSFFLSSLVLLLAMVGTIALTLKKQ
jgi:NADH:ubiquinone oxidoreductase subunit 6 (subunit J)